MVDKTFLVTLRTTDWDSDLLTQSTMNNLMKNRFDTTCVEVINCTVFRPDNYKPMATIATIKRVRELLNLGLRDAKYLVDTAKDKGSMKWADIEIVCDVKGNYNTPSEFRIIQN